MKNKWYRSRAVKTALVIAEHIFAAIIIVSVLCSLTYPVFMEEVFVRRESKTYEESLVFEKTLKNYSQLATNGVVLQEIWETDGEYDPDKIIDIEEYKEKGTVSGENTSGLAFRLSDLLSWDVYSSGYESVNDYIIVCEREDGTYQYYTYAVFASLIEKGELKLNGFLSSIEELHDYMEAMGDTGDNFLQIKDAEGNTLFVNCWIYNGTHFLEQCKPVDADSLLEIVNEDERWNGRLQEAYEMIWNTAEEFQDNEYNYSQTINSMQEGDTNFSFVYVDKGTGKIYSNQSAFRDFKKFDQYVQEIKKLGKYVVVEPLLQGFESNIPEADAEQWRSTVKYAGNSESDFMFVAGVDTTYSVHDTFYKEKAIYDTYAPLIKLLIISGIVSVVLFIAGLIWLTVIAGKNPENEEITLKRFDRWKTEIAAVLTVVLCVSVAAVACLIFEDNINGIFYTYEITEYNSAYPICILASTALFVIAFAIFLAGYLSLVRRIKAKTLWNDSILKKVIALIKHVLSHVHSIWKIILIFAVFVLAHWFTVMFYYADIFKVAAFIIDLAAAAYLIIYVIGEKKIKKGIQMIAEGNVDYKISTDKMLPDHKALAETVNKIGEGLDAAVEKSMKSERLKTDLITNVSHDIKTPLTSIINYVDLLKKENFQDPKVQRYIEVLEQKAQRLKVLTEDVVEASKVSSGNISLEYMKINFVEMIQQTSGEFEEKFKQRGLQEILRLPEEEVIIRVDGRRTWRILENIYNNAAKYAMEGSRVYADLKVTDKKAVFMLKNISEQQLNISADELTERFIRGDISRSTEGSGLGLSIARSLTEMQGGRFELYLDGDLFKVTVEFPIGDGVF